MLRLFAVLLMLLPPVAMSASGAAGAAEVKPTVKPTVAASAGGADSVPKDIIEKLALGESEEKIAAIAAIVGAGSDAGLALLRALSDGEVQIVADKKLVLLVKDGKATDAVTGREVKPVPEAAEDVVVNNV